MCVCVDGCGQGCGVDECVCVCMWVCTHKTNPRHTVYESMKRASCSVPFNNFINRRFWNRDVYKWLVSQNANFRTHQQTIKLGRIVSNERKKERGKELETSGQPSVTIKRENLEA